MSQREKDVRAVVNGDLDVAVRIILALAEEARRQEGIIVAHQGRGQTEEGANG